MVRIDQTEHGIDGAKSVPEAVVRHQHAVVHPAVRVVGRVVNDLELTNNNTTQRNDTIEHVL
jgi:hypothetical protein